MTIESYYHNVIRTLDNVSQTLENRQSSLASAVDAVAESVLEDLYEELDKAGFDNFQVRDPDVAVEVHDEDPSLIPDPTSIR